MIRVAGHFGEWLQGRLGPDGPLALITVACPALGVRAGSGPGLPTDVTGRFAEALGVTLPGTGLTADAPLGGGAGMSTAMLVALGHAADVRDPSRLAAACLLAEGAVDPLMLDRPDGVLWAPRQAKTLAAIIPPPEAEIVGGFLGSPVYTDPADERFPDIADLVALWAESQPDLPTAAAIASESARRTDAARGRESGPIPALAADLGALGVLRAHTGSACGLIFAPGKAPEAAEAALIAAGVTGVLRFRTGGQP